MSSENQPLLGGVAGKPAPAPDGDLSSSMVQPPPPQPYPPHPPMYGVSPYPPNQGYMPSPYYMQPNPYPQPYYPPPPQPAPQYHINAFLPSSINVSLGSTSATLHANVAPPRQPDSPADIVAMKLSTEQTIQINDKTKRTFALPDAFSVWRWVSSLMFCVRFGRDLWAEIPFWQQKILTAARWIPGLLADFIFLLLVSLMATFGTIYYSNLQDLDWVWNSSSNFDEILATEQPPGLIAMKCCLLIYGVPYLLLSQFLVYRTHFVVLRGQHSKLCFVRWDNLGSFSNRVVEVSRTETEVLKAVFGSDEQLIYGESRQEMESTRPVKINLYSHVFLRKKLCLFRNTGFVIYYTIVIVLAAVFDGSSLWYLVPSYLVGINDLMWLAYFFRFLSHGCNTCYDSVLSEAP